ncbi:MAG: hypothetical protein RLP44_18255, partial [Aggregatilineales bacterium]
MTTSGDPTWQARYTVSKFISLQIAAHNPKRCVVIVQVLGKPTILVWDLAVSTYTSVADVTLAIEFGGISPDGMFVYYHDGQRLQKVEFSATHKKHAITDSIAPFSPVSMSASLNGEMLGFSAARSDGFSLYTLETRNGATPKLLYRSAHPAFGPLLSYDAKHAVIAVTERKHYGDLSLLVFNLLAESSQQNVSVLEEHEGSIQPIMFSRAQGDPRLLAMTNATGEVRPLIWDVVSGDRTDFPLEEIEGDLTPLDWSVDAGQILLMQVEKAIHKLFIYDLNRSTFTPLLNLPAGTIHSAEFLIDSNKDDELVLMLETSEHPPHVTVVSSKDG